MAIAARFPSVPVPLCLFVHAGAGWSHYSQFGKVLQICWVCHLRAMVMRAIRPHKVPYIPNSAKYRTERTNPSAYCSQCNVRFIWYWILIFILAFTIQSHSLIQWFTLEWLDRWLEWFWIWFNLIDIDDWLNFKLNWVNNVNHYQYQFLKKLNHWLSWMNQWLNDSLTDCD